MGGCLRKPTHTLGQWFHLKPDTIQKGKTGKAQLISELGRPTIHLSAPGQNETLVYSYSSGDENKLDVGLLVVTCDTTDLVQDYYAGFSYSRQEEQAPKQDAKADYISESSIRIIQDLLNSNDPQQKISAVLLSFEGFRPGLLGFLQSYLKKQVDVETDLKVQAIYLLALDGIEDEKHERDTVHSARLLMLLSDHPEILIELESTNAIAAFAVKDFIEKKAGQCNRTAVSLIYRHIANPELAGYFSACAEDLFADQTECSLEFLGSLTAGELQHTIQLIGAKKDMESKAYLKIHYYASISDPVYGEVSRTILQTMEP